MNKTRTKTVYSIHYCIFCNTEAKVVTEPWIDHYLCGCIDAKDYVRLYTKRDQINKDINELEYRCNLEHKYRKMIQMELF